MQVSGEDKSHSDPLWPRGFMFISYRYEPRGRGIQHGMENASRQKNAAGVSMVLDCVQRIEFENRQSIT